MAGVFDTAFGRRWLFLWIFGLFAFTHLLYTSHIQNGPGSDSTHPCWLPLFYVLAVSFYTTLNFALWPDLSSSANIGTNTALGVGDRGLARLVSLHITGSLFEGVRHLTSPTPDLRQRIGAAAGRRISSGAVRQRDAQAVHCGERIVNLTSVALFVVALLMMSAAPGTDSAQLLLDGNHRVVRTEGAIIVAEASVEIPAEGQVAGPIYVIGGQLDVAGRVETDIVQLAGTVTIGDGAVVAGEFQHIAGARVIDANAAIGRMTAVGMEQTSSPGIGRWLSLTTSAAIVAAISVVMVRWRPAALANVSNATIRHPVISLTVGTMVSITFLSLFVFMAFTLVLIPVALLGALAGLVVMVYGVIGWGHARRTRIPDGFAVRRRPGSGSS